MGGLRRVFAVEGKSRIRRSGEETRPGARTFESGAAPHPAFRATFSPQAASGETSGEKGMLRRYSLCYPLSAAISSRRFAMVDKAKLETLRDLYRDAKGGDMHDPHFRKVAEKLFQGGDRRKWP